MSQDPNKLAAGCGELSEQQKIQAHLTQADRLTSVGMLIAGVAHDSRKVRPGDVFVCLRGRDHDGHAHAAQALERGATLILGEQDALPGIGPYVQVEDTRKALTRFSRKREGGPERSLTSPRTVRVAGLVAWQSAVIA